MASMININENEIIIENAKIVNNDSKKQIVVYSRRKYETDLKENLDNINLNDITNNCVIVDNVHYNMDYELKYASNCGIQPHRIKDVDIVKPNEKQPNLWKLLINKLIASKTSSKTDLNEKANVDDNIVFNASSTSNTIMPLSNNVKYIKEVSN